MAAALFAGAFLAAASSAGESQKVVVEVKVVRCSGERTGVTEFDSELARIRSKLDRLFGGYAKYELLEGLVKYVSFKAPAAFKLQAGPRVTITVNSFEKGRFVADLEIHDGAGRRVGGMTVRVKEGSYNFTALSRKSKELTVVAYRVTRAPAGN